MVYIILTFSQIQEIHEKDLSVQESTRSNAAQTLANEILEEAQNPQNNSMKELRYLLIKAYLQSIESKQKTGMSFPASHKKKI